MILLVDVKEVFTDDGEVHVLVVAVEVYQSASGAQERKDILASSATD